MDRKPRILIVDDEPDVAEGLRAIFEAKACHVDIATGKAEAQQKVWADKPDAIVVGTMMPRGDAYLLHKWLRETPPFNDAPMIVIDAPVEKQLLKGWRKEEGLRLDADEYLVKPVEPAALALLVEKMLDKSTRRIRVLVADDHAIIRDGIRALLGVQKDMQVVGEAVDGQDALEKTRQLSPDVVLMDIVMPGMNGLDAAKEICRHYQQAKVLMLTQYDDEENVRASQELGALGFIPKTVVSSQLLNGIRSVYEGKKFIYTFDQSQN